MLRDVRLCSFNGNDNHATHGMEGDEWNENDRACSWMIAMEDDRLAHSRPAPMQGLGKMACDDQFLYFGFAILTHACWDTPLEGKLMSFCISQVDSGEDSGKE